MHRGALGTIGGSFDVGVLFDKRGTLPAVYHGNYFLSKLLILNLLTPPIPTLALGSRPLSSLGSSSFAIVIWLPFA